MDMANFMGICLVLGLVFGAAFYQLSAILWTVLIGIGLLLVTVFASFGILPLFLLWLIFLAAAAFANLHQLRQQYVVKRAVKTLQSQLPPISATEREAINAGNTWWEKDLFCGRPDWKKLFAYPRPTLSADETSFIDNQTENLCNMLNDWEIMRDGDLPKEVWDYLKNEKFFGMVIPKEYGGLGFSALGHSTVVTKIATRSMSAAVNTMVPNSLGPGELLVHYGTDAQKNYYLPRLASGIEVPCFGLTGPEAGSDATSIPDSGVVCRGMHEGKEVIGILLNWNKRYITLAPIATVLGLAFQMYDPDHLLGENENIGITLCLIPATHPGVEIGNRHYPVRLAFMNGPIHGKDVFIPLDWIIGGPEMAGQGWRMLMECLSIGRSISLPAVSSASGKLVYRFTGAYARVRRQFNSPIAAFEGIEEALGYIAGNTYLLEAARIMTAGAVDQHIKPSIVSAIAKYHMTEIARTIVNHAMDVEGGHGIQMGPRNYLANIYFGMPIIITVEGANILTRNLIIFGQGAIRCHPYLLEEVELISAPETNIAALDKVLMSHIGYFVSNLIRSFAYGITGGLFIFASVKNRRVKKYQRQLTRMSTALALLSDTSLILLGGSLKRRERISARLGDMMSQLYLASTVLKYYYDNNQPDSDVDYVCWCLQECLAHIQIAADDLLHNFPNRFIGYVLRFIIFPFNTAYYGPSDKLHQSIVMTMLSSSELRDRITKYCYVSPNENDYSNRLETALAEVAAIDPLIKKVQKAVHTGEISQRFTFQERVIAAEKAGILTANEAEALSHYEKLKQEIIKVDDFTFKLDEVIA